MEMLEIPSDFRCPISHDLMTDPVILTSGHTFDRISIQLWLDYGHRTCPITNTPLPPSPTLIPNHALRSLISNFTSKRPPIFNPIYNPAPPPTKTLTPPLLSYPAASADLEYVLRLLRRHPPQRRLLAHSAAVSVLIRHAAAAASPSDDRSALALRCLLYLSLDGDDARVGLVAEGAVDAAVAGLRGRSAALAATVLTSLAVVEVNKCTIGAHPAAIPALVRLLSDGFGGAPAREAATALYELCKLPGNRRRVVRAGAVPHLLLLAGRPSERAVEVLGLLAKCTEGRKEIQKAGGVVGVLVRVLRSGIARGVENGLLVLDLVCGDCTETAAEAVREGVLELCLDLAVKGNEKVSRNALTLARRLENRKFARLVC